MTNNKARVLVVDDEPVVRMSYERSLAAEFDAHSAPDGEQALREMKREPADVAGWVMLMRSYKTLGRDAEARAALQRAVAANPGKRAEIEEAGEALGVR